MEWTRACRSSCIVLLALSFSGCQRENDGAEVPEEDVEEGRVVQSWTLSPGPVLSIGGLDERPDYVLHDVRDVTRLSDGRILVANGGTTEVLVYNARGEYQQAIGGAGDGPGEFRLLRNVARLPGDSLLVFAQNSGLTWFNASGEHVRSERFSVATILRVPCRTAEGGYHPLDDGTFVVVMQENPGGPGCPELQEPGTVFRKSGLVARAIPGTAMLDTFGIFPAEERVQGRSIGDPGPRVPGTMHFGRELLVTTSRDIVYVAESGGDEVLALSLSGDTVAVYPIPFESQPLLPDARDIRPGAGVVEGADMYPRAGRLLGDTEGLLWIMSYPRVSRPLISGYLATPQMGVMFLEPEGAMWKVIDREGEVVSEVRTPPRFFPVEIGPDYVLGVSRGAMGVESVQVYSLERQ